MKFVGDGEKLKCLLDKTQKLVCYALSKDKVHLKQQSVNPNEESKSVSESDSVPQTKKIKLSESCQTLTDWQRYMMKGEMLSDISVTTAQTLLMKQFPNFNGSQPTFYQQRNQPVESVAYEKNQLQIIHCRGNHWVAVSSIGCENDFVYVYESLYTSLDETTKQVVSSQFHARCITMQPMQKQVDRTDCGLFAVTVITAICYGKDTSQMHFKQDEMRDHLLKCFKDKYMTVFLALNY